MIRYIQRSPAMRAIILVALAGCSANSTVSVSESVYALGAALDTAEKAELVYMQSGIASPTVIADLKRLDLQAYNAIAPLVANQNNVTADEVAAAEAAISALTQYMVQNGVKS